MAVEDAAAAASPTTTATPTVTEEQNSKPPAASVEQSPSDKQDETKTTPSIRKTLFPTPAPLTQVPPAPTLTPEQETKYTTLLESIRSWSPKDNLPDSERCWLTRKCLLRYLRASSWNLATAQKRLEATISWRRSYGVETKLSPSYISIENETSKQWIIGGAL